MIRIGIIGLGFGERVHLPAFRYTKRFEVYAISSRTPGKATEAAKHLSVPKAYGRWQDLVKDPVVEAVSIAAPPSDQFEIALAAIENHKALFLEKPLALTLTQANKLALKARRSRIPLIVDFEFSAIAEWIKAKELLEKNALGRIRRVSVTWHLETYAHQHHLDTWKLRTAEGGGALFQFMPHVFYYLEWLAGPIASVSAKLNGQDKKPAEDSSAALSLAFKNGAMGTVSLATDAFAGSGHRSEFYGENGMMALENASSDPVRGFRLKWSLRSGDSGTFTSPQDSDERDGRVEAVAGMARRLADWIEKGIASKPSWEEGLRVQRLLDAALVSSRRSKHVKVSA